MPTHDPIVVLLVDDQPIVAAAILGLLEENPEIQLHYCRHATEAIPRANELRPALILQDLMMPDVDGLTLVRCYRRNRTTAKTPIVMLSGNDDSDSLKNARDAGADDYLIKLPTRNDLLDCIQLHVPAAASSVSEPAAAVDIQPDTLDPNVMAVFGTARAGGSPDFKRRLIGQILEEAASKASALHAASERHDRSALQATAHGLKGASLIMGARRLAAVCGELEDDIKTDRHREVEPLLSLIDEELVRVRHAFAAEWIGPSQATHCNP